MWGSIVLIYVLIVATAAALLSRLDLWGGSGREESSDVDPWFGRWLLLESSMFPWPVRGNRLRRFGVEVVVAGVLLVVGVGIAWWLAS